MDFSFSPSALSAFMEMLVWFVFFELLMVNYSNRISNTTNTKHSYMSSFVHGAPGISVQ